MSRKAASRKAESDKRLKLFKAAADAAVAAGERHDIPTAPTIGSIQAEAQELKKRRMREAGIAPIRIPKKADKLRAVICTMLRHLDEGGKLRASRAVWEAGLSWEAGWGDDSAAKKLAYRVPIKSADVHAAICLMVSSPFVCRLRQDDGWQRQVTAGHRSLSALATTLQNARRSLAAQAATGTGDPPRARCWWHPEARTLRAAHWTGNQIANRLKVNVKTVESFLRRERLKKQGA